MTRKSKRAKKTPKALRGRLRRVRKKTGLNQADFAAAIGFSRPQVKRYELGDVEPSRDFLVSVAKVFSVDLHWLLTGERCRTKKHKAEMQAAINILQPYVEAYLGTVFEDSARIQEEITDLETNPDQKSYDGGDPRERVVYLRKILHRQLNYYGKVMDDLRAVGIIEN